MMDNENVADGGMIGKGNGSARRKPVSVPFRPPQMSNVLTWESKPGRHGYMLWHHAMKAYGVAEGTAPFVLASPLN
jgi:hypothetical protein